MIIPFIEAEYIQFRDMERCPYIGRDYQYKAWMNDDNKRLLLIALDRYSKALICKHEIVAIQSIFGLFQQCMKCERYSLVK